MTRAVQIIDVPYATKVGGKGKVHLTRVDIEDIGVVIGGPDLEGDMLVLFDERVESISPKCLALMSDPTRVQLWQDAYWLEVGDHFEAVELYLHHRQYVKSVASRSGKTCSACGEFKTVSEFGADARNRDGLNIYCRSCRNEHYEARTRAFM